VATGELEGPRRAPRGIFEPAGEKIRLAQGGHPEGLLPEDVRRIAFADCLFQRDAGLVHARADEVRQAQLYADEYSPAFTAMAQARVSALVVLSDPVFFRDHRRIAELSLKYRLPAIHIWREFAKVGGFMTCGPNTKDMASRAAGYVDRILRGARPAHMPVEQPTKFELVISLKTAKALGLTIPPSLLLRADQVIE
jgi:hypothetical protein